MKQPTRLIGSAPTIEQLRALISKFYGGADITLKLTAEASWTVSTRRGPIDGVRVVAKSHRYRFEAFG